MGKKAPAAPPAPDPVATAQAQAGANKDAILESARVNQIKQVSPFGVVSYEGAIGSPDRRQITRLDPTDQANLDTQRKLATALTSQALQRSGQIPSAAFSLNGFDKIDQDYARGITDKAYQGFSDKIGEQYGRDQEALRTQLVNQGINVGNEAYSRAEQDLVAYRDRALRDAYTAALSEGRNDLATQLNVRQQGINDYLLERTQPLNELSAYLQGAPALQGPQTSAPTQYQVSPADVQGAYNTQYQGALNNYNQRVGSNNAKMGATSGLGGAALGGYLSGISDTNLKTDITPVNLQSILDGLSIVDVSRWRYKPGIIDDQEHIGCMAQDFQAAFGLGDGKTINFIDAIGVCMASIKALSTRVQELEANQCS